LNIQKVGSVINDITFALECSKKAKGNDPEKIKAVMASL